MISSAKQSVRITTLQNRAKSQGQALGSSLLKKIASRYPKGGWILQEGDRTIQIIVPEDEILGPYIIMISGDPEPLIRANIDKYAANYSFHRKSALGEELEFTLEWTALPTEQYAYSVIYFLNTLELLSKGGLFSN